ncbi:MAG: metallophosphoesterase, partial [Chthonomonadales bacterium]
TDLTPGVDFTYRMLLDGKQVFESKARPRKSAIQPYRVVVFGDCGEGTPGEKQIAYQTSVLNPDFIFIPGDIVYTHGSISEYRKNFFPVYNADKASLTEGAPLQRSTLFLAAPGNHDVDGRDLNAFPDGMAYFYLWYQPLNGPTFPLNAPQTPTIKGPTESTLPFLTAALPQYPVMANYSFDYGNTHWTVLDSNPYTDWTKPPLRDWLEKDLASAQGSTWRVVTFHHPGLGAGFRPDDPKMQAVGSIMAKGKVDVVFNGHLHTYFCSRPIKYEGSWTFDSTYDGVKKTKPDGTIYVITGAGGAHLHELNKEMMLMNLLARKSIPGKYSLTVADVNGRTMTLRQIGTDGKEMDHYVITK